MKYIYLYNIYCLNNLSYITCSKKWKLWENKRTNNKNRKPKTKRETPNP